MRQPDLSLTAGHLREPKMLDNLVSWLVAGICGLALSLGVLVIEYFQ